MGCTHDNAPSGANPSLNIELEGALRDLRTVSTLIAQHADQGIEANVNRLTREMWWQHIDVLDWLSDRLKASVEQAWCCYESRMPANQKQQADEQPAGTLRDLEARFHQLYAEWGSIGDEDEFDEDDKDKILIVAGKVIDVLKAMTECRIERVDDAACKIRVALKRLSDGSRIGDVGPPDDELCHMLLTDARDFLERFTAA